MICFTYSDFPTFDNASHLTNFFQTNFINLFPELYTLHYFLRHEIAVLEFLYKTISIVHLLGNIYENNCTEIFKLIS